MYFPLTFGKMIFNFRNYLFLLCLFFSYAVQAQKEITFTKYDYLHGKLNANRNWFDVNHYNITVKIDPSKKYISGNNIITYTVLKSAGIMQLDVHGLIKIDSIVFRNNKIAYTRDSSIVLIKLPKAAKNSTQQIKVYFSGYPLIASKAPWSGGFVFTKDSLHRDWVGLACQGLGASTWLPCKDHNSDEADSVTIHLQVPEGLTGVSNGKLIGSKTLHNGFHEYVWKVTYPINNYNITINVGHYKLIADTYTSITQNYLTPLSLNYYVLDYNYNKALEHFKQVKTMLSCYERFFNPYPFWNDGYKLVETPYWGMEHQSCVSYGNDYTNNRWDFDFIIIHESAHEWFGNCLTAPDPAELWIHESFTTYAESVFLECTTNKETAQKYLNMQKRNIENNVSMIGTRDVFFHHFPDNDIYYKGTWMLHTIRNVLNNDTLWFNTLKDYVKKFAYKNVTTQQTIDFICTRTNTSLQKIFEQYLTAANLPVYEYQIKENARGNLELRYRWNDVVDGFQMPIKVTLSKDSFQLIIPDNKWRVADINFFNKKDFRVDTSHYLFTTKEIK